MPLSSDTLFHFTDSQGNLLNILQKTFLPHWSLENLNVLLPEGEPNEALIFGIPMVSFCDIPLSQTVNHMNNYGSYGIGMTKEWGMTNGICPVLYTNSGSNLAGKFKKLAQNIAQANENSELPAQLMEEFYDITCYVKPYEGLLQRPGGKNKGVRFYDEREWRYVATLPIESFRFGIDQKVFEKPELLQQANEHLHTQDQIHFIPRDIKYLIVATEKEILPLIHKVETIKGKFDQDEIKLLTTRIISAEQIKGDF